MTRALLALTLTLGIAGVTHAGGGPDLDPIASAVDVCGETDVADNTMDTPTAFFFAFPDCESLCGKAERVCKTLQKRKSGCYLDHIKSQGIWSKRACKVAYSVPAEIKQCEKTVKSLFAEDIGAYKDVQAAALAQCHEWGETCRNTCEL